MRNGGEACQQKRKLFREALDHLHKFWCYRPSDCGTLFGTWFGGFLADRFGKKDKRVYVVIPAIALIIALPFLWFMYNAQSVITLLVLLPLPK